MQVPGKISDENWLFLLSYAPQHRSGAGLSTFSFAKYATSRGVNSTILTLNRKLKEKPSETIEDVRFKRIPYFNHNLLTKLFSLIWIQFYYLKFCLQNKVVWITGGKIIGLEMMLLWCWVFKRKIIFRSANQEVDDMTSLLKVNFLLSGIRKFLFSKIHIYYSLHPNFTWCFRKEFHSKISIFQSVQGVDFTRFKTTNTHGKLTLRKKLNLPENKFIIVTLGVLTKRKGFIELIDFLAKVDFDFFWIILGEKDFGKNHFLENKILESVEIQQKGKKTLGKKVEFRGWIENPEEYLTAADIFISGGVCEGIPNACLQAMTCGLPCLIRNNPGFDEMLGAKEKAVLLFNTGKEFHELINKLQTMNSFYQTISNHALNFAHKNFSYEKIFDEIVNSLNNKNE